MQVEEFTVNGIKFVFTKIQNNPEGNGETWMLSANGSCVCYYTTWALSSCAMGSLSGFRKGDWNGTFWKKTENIDAVVELLKKHGSVDGGYNPKEVIFLLGPSFSPKELCGHPNVKRIDAFTNKAHDGWPVHIYRMSISKDFNTV